MTVPTSGLPERTRVDYDGRLTGWWYTVDGEGELDVMLGLLPEEEKLGVIWNLHPFGVCWAAQAYPAEIDGATYYDAKRIAADVLGGRCEDYTGEGEVPGHIIVRTRIDANGCLFLRFMKNNALVRLASNDGIELRYVEPPEDRVVEAYPLVTMSGEDLAALLRGEENAGLFSAPYGPFHGVDLDKPPTPRTREPWKEL